MNVTDNYFSGDFLFLDGEYSCLKISKELSFQNGKLIFNQLPFSVSDVIKLKCHLLTVPSSQHYALQFPIHRNNHIVPLPTIDLNKKDLLPCLPNRR
jgi:hypothetical protein